MKKGIMRLEGLEQTQADVDMAQVVPVTVPAAMLESEQLDGELQGQAVGIEEATEIEGNMQVLHDDLVKVRDEGRDLTDFEATTVKATMEHYRCRLGYAKPALLTMEGYSTAADKKKQLDLTIESIGNTILNTVKSKFSVYLWICTAIYKKTSLQKEILRDLGKELSQVSSAFQENASGSVVSGRFITDLVTGASDTKADKIITNVDAYTKRITAGNHSKVLSEATKRLVSVNDTVRDVWFFSSSKDVSSLETEVESLRKLVRGLSDNKEYQISLNGGVIANIKEGDDDEVSVSVTKKTIIGADKINALTKQEKDKLVTLCERLIAESNVIVELEKMAKGIQTVYGFTAVNNIFRLSPKIMTILTAPIGGIGGWYSPDDLRLAMSATTSAEQLRTIFFEDMSQRARVIKAIISYIRESSK